MIIILEVYISSIDVNSNTYYESHNDNHPSIDEFDNIFNNICFNYSKANWPALINAVLQINWLSVFAGCTDVNDYWSTFHSVLLNCVQVHVPKFNNKAKKSTRKKYSLYIRKLFNKKALACKILKRTHSDIAAAKYKVIANKCTAELHNYVSKVENDLIRNGNLGSFYRYVNNKTSVKSGVAPLQDTAGVTHTNDLSKANALNDYSASVFTTDNGSCQSLMM